MNWLFILSLGLGHNGQAILIKEPVTQGRKTDIFQ